MQRRVLICERPIDCHRRLVVPPTPFGLCPRIAEQAAQQGGKRVPPRCRHVSYLLRRAEASGFFTSAREDRSDTAHTLALVRPEIELAAVGGRRKIDVVEWNA